MFDLIAIVAALVFVLLVLQLRAQSLIADESRGALVRAEAALSETTQRLALARRDAGEAQTRAHQLHVELLRETEQAQAALARRCDSTA